MATSPRRSQSTGRATSGAPNMLPVFATLGIVVVAAAAVAVMNKPPGAEASDARDDAAPTTTPSDIFGDVDTSLERIPTKRSGSTTTTTNDAPAGLADAPVFVEARRTVADAKVLVEAALAAQKAGDDATWSEKANAAREKLEHVLEATAEWHIELGDKWGSDDAQMRQIDAEIATWQKLLTKVRKAH